MYHDNDAPRPRKEPLRRHQQEQQPSPSLISGGGANQALPPGGARPSPGTSHQDDQHFGGIDFPTPVVEEGGGEVLQTPIEFPDEGLRTGNAMPRQPPAAGLRPTPSESRSSRAWAPATDANPAAASLRPTTVAFEMNDIGGDGTGQFTTTAIGPIFGPQRHHRQRVHPFFQESGGGAADGDGRGTSRRSIVGGGSERATAAAGDTFTVGRLHHVGGGHGLFDSIAGAKGHSSSAFFESTGLGTAHPLSGDSYANNNMSSSNLRKRRNINLMHIFDQRNSFYSSWTMMFVDPSMEMEYLRFFYQPKRVAAMGYCIIAVVVAAVAQLMYASVTIPEASRALFVLVTITWAVAGVLSYQLRRDALVQQKISEDEEVGLRTIDELLEGETLSDDDDAKESSAALELAETNQSTMIVGDRLNSDDAWGPLASSGMSNWARQSQENIDSAMRATTHHKTSQQPSQQLQQTEDDITSCPSSHEAPRAAVNPLVRRPTQQPSVEALHTPRGVPDRDESANDDGPDSEMRMMGEYCADDLQSTTRFRCQSQTELAFITIARRLGKQYEDYTTTHNKLARAHQGHNEKQQQRVAGRRTNGQSDDLHGNHNQVKGHPQKRSRGLFYESESDDDDQPGGHTLSRKAIEDEFRAQWNSKSRVRLRLIAARTERVMLLILLGNFMMCYAMYIGKGDCTAPSWSEEDSRRACSENIQSDGITLILIIVGAFFTPTRVCWFMPLYVLLLGLYYAIKWIPGMLEVNLVYFWCAFVVFTAEALVCVGLVAFHERNTRAECKLNIRRYVKHREAAQVRRQAERTVGAQVPVEVLRMAMMQNKMLSSKTAQDDASSAHTGSRHPSEGDATAHLWGWSERMTYCCVSLDGFSSWTQTRGPSQIVELTQAVLNLFDRLRMRCVCGFLKAPIPKAHRFGDSYSVFLIPPSGASQDVREAVDVAVGFALLCISEGSDLIRRRFGNAETWGDAAALRVRAALAVGPGGGSLLSETRNVVVVGSVVQETRDMLTACGGVTQWSEILPSKRSNLRTVLAAALPTVVHQQGDKGGNLSVVMIQSELRKRRTCRFRKSSLTMRHHSCRLLAVIR